MKNRFTIYNILFSLAIISITFGIGLLFVTVGKMNINNALFMLLFIAIAALASQAAYITKAKAKLVFFALFTLSISIITFIVKACSLSIAKYWTFYVIAAGLCFLPASYIRYSKFKTSTTIISVIFIVLGILFSVFSFGFSSMRFKVFVASWWPILILSAGIILFIVWALQSFKHRVDKK